MTTLYEDKEFGPPPSAPKALCMAGTVAAAPVSRESRNGGKPDKGNKTSIGGSTQASAGGSEGQEDTKSLTYEYGSNSKKNTVDNNRSNNAQNSAKVDSVRGDVVLLWSPELRAKQGITLTNLGPENSGEWYVQTCTHGWTVGQGGGTKLHVLRSEPDTEQKGGKEGSSSIKQGIKAGLGDTVGAT